MRYTQPKVIHILHLFLSSLSQAASGLERALRMEIKSAFHQSNLMILFEHYKHVAPQTGMSQTADHLSFRATLEMMKDFQVRVNDHVPPSLSPLFFSFSFSPC